MQNLENDMDDLFRRASEKYPLNTGQSNWESIEEKLSAAEVGADSQKPERKNNFEKSGLLLLLLFISLIAGLLILNRVHINYQAVTNAKKTNRNENPNNKTVATEKIPLSQLAEKAQVNQVESTNERPEILPVNTQLKGNKSQIINLAAKNNSRIFSNKSFSRSPGASDQKDKYMKDQTAIANETEKNLRQSKAENKTFLPENSDKNPVTENKGTPNKNLSSSIKKTKSSGTEITRENGFYLGMIAGPDFSNVKSSAFSNPGVGVGIVAGYDISKVVFIETGVVGNSKYYYSEGEMFNKESASMPDEMIVNNLESRSEIIEIPIKIGYRFCQTKNTELFAAGGIAAYIMTKEENHYNVTMNGTPEKMEGIYTKNNSKFPAILSISAGLEEKISGILKIRIEPYLKLPLQGIGVGELPVTSAGIQIGLVRDFN